MDKYIITEGQLKKAEAYLPLQTKEKFVDFCARRCLDTQFVNLGVGENDAMPSMYTENTFLKSRYLMSALCLFYLCIPNEDLHMEGEDPWLMGMMEYDTYAGSHLLNQLDRMKGNAEYRDKIFDILRDYRDLEKRLNTAIYGLLSVMNDPINRMFQKLAADTSEEALAEQRKNLEELTRQLEELKKEKGKEEKG